MSGQLKLVLDILQTFHKEGVLEDMVLIGSWSHFFYGIHYSHPPEMPRVRTLDIDFLVPYPRKVKKKVNVMHILESFDFRPEFHRLSGLIKFIHPDLKLEFLVPMRGPGQEEPYKIEKFSINAVGLRMLDLLEKDPIEVTHKDFAVKVPQPAAYALHKFLINKRRKNPEKKIKDLEAAVGISHFLMRSPGNKKQLRKIFTSLHKKWRKDILDLLDEAYPELKMFFLAPEHGSH